MSILRNRFFKKNNKKNNNKIKNIENIYDFENKLYTFSTYPEFINFNVNYEALILSGGGNRGIIQLGMLHSLYLKSLLNNIKVYCGTSIGSIILYLLNIGCSPLEIFIHTYMNNLMENITLNQNNIINFVFNYGLLDINIIFKVIEKISIEKLGFIPCFKKLYEITNKILIIPVHDLTNNKTIYFDYKNSPNLSCIEALKMSSNIPLIFNKYIYNNVYIIDGGMSDNFPIEYIDKTFPKLKKIGLSTISKVNVIPNNSNIINYLYAVLTTCITTVNLKSKKYKSHNIHIVHVEVDNQNFLSFNKNSLFNYFSIGYNIITNNKYLIKNKVVDKLKNH